MKTTVICALISLFLAGCACENKQAEKTFGQEPWKGASCGQSEIFGYGDCFVLQTAPNLVDDTTFQLFNDFAQTKIKPKKASEIKSNLIGINTTRMPRSRESDYYYSSPAHLIDGNVKT